VLTRFVIEVFHLGRAPSLLYTGDCVGCESVSTDEPSKLPKSEATEKPLVACFDRRSAMACRSCGSKEQRKFGAEISVHVLGVENVDKPTVWAFPRLLVCMNCGFTELTIAEDELRQLGKNPPSDIEAAG